jgi:hypothetical protein
MSYRLQHSGVVTYVLLAAVWGICLLVSFSIGYFSRYSPVFMLFERETYDKMRLREFEHRMCAVRGQMQDLMMSQWRFNDIVDVPGTCIPFTFIFKEFKKFIHISQHLSAVHVFVTSCPLFQPIIAVVLHSCRGIAVSLFWTMVIIANQSYPSPETFCRSCRIGQSPSRFSTNRFVSPVNPQCRCYCFCSWK